MNIMPLRQNNPQHTRIVLSLLIHSTLDYGERDMDQDVRLLAWHAGQGKWAAALPNRHDVAGIVCVVHLSDSDQDALLWLEVLPRYRRRGYGRALLRWAQTQTVQPLVIKSVPGAVGFYQHTGLIA